MLLHLLERLQVAGIEVHELSIDVLVRHRHTLVKASTASVSNRVLRGQALLTIVSLLGYLRSINLRLCLSRHLLDCLLGKLLHLCAGCRIATIDIRTIINDVDLVSYHN